MGILSVFTCACNFSIIGVVAGYSGASSETSKAKLVFLKGFAFLLGTIISMSVIGALFGFGLPLAAMIIGISLGLGKMSRTLSLVVKIVKYTGGVALVALGFYLLFTF